MHPRQASLLAQAADLSEKLAAKKKDAQPKPGVGGAVLWQYTDAEVGKQFYLEERKMTGVRSPYSGKVISTKPIRYTPAQVGKELKEEAKAVKTASTF